MVDGLQFKIKKIKFILKTSLKRKLWPFKVFVKNIFLFFYHNNNLSRILFFKNKYLNQSCFIIGNGPSLSVKDLELIKNYKSFASNSIFKIYSKTKWRPDFYGVCDKLYFEENSKNILKNNSSISFYPFDFGLKKNKSTFFYLRQQKFLIKKPPMFSSRADIMLFDGSTVTYMLIQLAVYMGFKKIYLLGVDFSYSKVVDINGNLKIDNSIKDYFTDESSKNNSVTPNLDQSYLSYQSVLNYANRNSIKIINLTRKTNLDIFECKKIDDEIDINYLK